MYLESGLQNLVMDWVWKKNDSGLETEKGSEGGKEGKCMSQRYIVRGNPDISVLWLMFFTLIM